MARRNAPWFRSGCNAWYVKFQGKQVRLHEEEDEAFRKWHRLEAGLDQPPAQGEALASVIDRYLADAEKRLKPSSMMAKKKVLLRLKADKGKCPAERFDADALVEFLNGTGWGQSYRWLAAGIVKTMMLWAVGRKILKASPVAGVKVKPPLNRGAETIIPAEVHHRLMLEASPAHKAIFTALWETGCRPSEVCGVEAKHFDAGAGCWKLDQHKTDSGGKVRVIYLSPSMVALCKVLAKKHPTGKLFRNEQGKAFTTGMLHHWLYRTKKRLGFSNIILYGYRHSFATSALANGVPDAQVAELLGHRGTAVLHRHYAHLGARSDVLRNALGKVR